MAPQAPPSTKIGEPMTASCNSFFAMLYARNLRAHDFCVRRRRKKAHDIYVLLKI